MWVMALTIRPTSTELLTVRGNELQKLGHFDEALASYDEAVSLEPDNHLVLYDKGNALHALTLLIARQMISDLESLDPRIEYFVLPPLCPLTGSPYDFSHTSELITRAMESTDAWLADGGLDRPNVHTQLGLHKHSH